MTDKILAWQRPVSQLAIRLCPSQHLLLDEEGRQAHIPSLIPNLETPHGVQNSASGTVKAAIRYQALHKPHVVGRGHRHISSRKYRHGHG